MNSTRMPPVDSVSFAVHQLPAVRTAGRFRHDDRDFSRVYRSSTHALHIYDYPGRIRIGDVEHAFHAGDMTLTPAGMPTRYHLAAPGNHWCVHFATRLGEGDRATLPLYASLGGLAAHAAEKVLHIGRWFSTGGAVAEAAASAALLELILWLATQTARARGHAPPTRGVLAARQVATIIQTRYAEPLHVPDLADEVEISQNYLARVFHGWYGMTIQQYLLRRRIDAARHLLTVSSIPIHRVAMRVGLEDRQYFNKQFRRIAGMSPSAFREQAQRRAKA